MLAQVAPLVQRRPSPRWALISLYFCMLLSSLATSIANVGLPVMALAFDASFQQVQWIVIAYLLTVTSLIVSIGAFGDFVGRRRLLLVGLALFVTASILCGVAHALWLLIAARAMQGLGAGIMMTMTMALVGATVPQARTGSAMGLLGTMSAIGTALGPSLGGFLIACVGWQAIFFVNVPVGLLTFILAFRYLPAERPVSMSKRPAFDTFGALLLGLTLAAYALAMTVGGGAFGSLNAILLSAAALGAVCFLLVEARVSSPLIQLRLFRARALSGGLSTSVLASAVVMTTLIVGPFYLSSALDLDPTLVGLVLTVGPMVAALTGVPAGRIVDRYGARHAIVAGLLGMAGGSVILSILPLSFGIPGYVGPIAVITAGYALFQTANNTAVTKAVGPERRGAVSGMLSLSRNLGLVTGASVMGAVFAFGSGEGDFAVALPIAVASGMKITFAVAALLMTFALAIAAWGLASKRHQSTEGEVS